MFKFRGQIKINFAEVARTFEISMLAYPIVGLLGILASGWITAICAVVVAAFVGSIVTLIPPVLAGIIAVGVYLYGLYAVYHAKAVGISEPTPTSMTRFWQVVCTWVIVAILVAIFIL